MQSELQENSATPHPEICETCPYFAIFRPQTGLERKDCPTAWGATIRVFLWRAHAQSGFNRSLGECNAIRSRGFGHSELTCVGILETDCGASHKLVSGQPGKQSSSLDTSAFIVTYVVKLPISRLELSRIAADAFAC